MSKEFREVIRLLATVGPGQSFADIKRDTQFLNLYKGLQGKEQRIAKLRMIAAIQRNKKYRVKGLENSNNNNSNNNLNQKGGTRRHRRNSHQSRRNRK